MRTKFIAKLTYFLGWLIICMSSALSTTATGSFSVSTQVLSGSGATNNVPGATCSVSANNMIFAAYTGTLITATSEISVNCTSGTTFTISFNDSPEASPAYYLVTGTGDTAAKRLNVTFTNTTGQTMIKDSATITGTGTGSSAAAGTITGSIVGSQTGKIAGSYSKTMTLNIVYNSNLTN